MSRALGGAWWGEGSPGISLTVVLPCHDVLKELATRHPETQPGTISPCDPPGTPQDPLSPSQSSRSLLPHSQVKDEVMKPLLRDAVVEPHCGDQMGTGTGSVSPLPCPPWPPPPATSSTCVCAICSPHPHTQCPKGGTQRDPSVGPHTSPEEHPAYPQGVIQGVPRVAPSLSTVVTPPPPGVSPVTHRCWSA